MCQKHEPVIDLLLRVQCCGKLEVTVCDANMESKWFRVFATVPICAKEVILQLPRARVGHAMRSIARTLVGRFCIVRIDIPHASHSGDLRDIFLPLYLEDSLTESLSLGMHGCTMTAEDIVLFSTVIQKPPSQFHSLSLEIDVTALNDDGLNCILYSLQQKGLSHFHLTLWTMEHNYVDTYNCLHKHS